MLDYYHYLYGFGLKTGVGNHISGLKCGHDLEKRAAHTHT